jgi:hypothetical protein
MINQLGKNFDFGQPGGKVVIYAMSCFVKETFFSVGDRDALIKLVFGRTVLKTNICRKMGASPNWK